MGRYVQLDSDVDVTAGCYIHRGELCAMAQSVAALIRFVWRARCLRRERALCGNVSVVFVCCLPARAQTDAPSAECCGRAQTGTSAQATRKQCERAKQSRLEPSEERESE